MTLNKAKPASGCDAAGPGNVHCSASFDTQEHSALAPNSQAKSGVKELCVVAFDPGICGGYGFLFRVAGAISAFDIPTVDGNLDAATLSAHVAQMRPDLAIIERVGSMPGQGVSSTFRFGCAYGMVQGIVAAQKIPVHFVSPAKWKKHFGLPADKEASRARALQLWPNRTDLFGRKRDHNRAEAALLALYGSAKIVGGGA
jgi:crossover junction endodeoxyribonuclease RuvC